MQIDINRLSFAFGHKVIMEDLSLSLSKGDFMVIRGKNGTGKSTFVKCLLGIYPVNSSMIFYDHEDINNFTSWTKMGYVPQKFEDFNYEFPITVNEILSVAKLKNTNSADKLKLLDQMGILEIVNDNINNLSGGQLQRVFIVRAMLNHPELIILDEPTASIDKMNTEYFFQTVNRLNEEGVTVILITHDESLDLMNYSHVLQMDLDSEYKFFTREQFLNDKAVK